MTNALACITTINGLEQERVRLSREVGVRFLRQVDIEVERRAWAHLGQLHIYRAFSTAKQSWIGALYFIRTPNIDLAASAVIVHVFPHGADQAPHINVLRTFKHNSP